MSLKVTITDIANKLKTTPATVSRALNDHPSISEKRKKIIRETALRLNYKRNRIASSLRSGQTGLIGVIIPSAQINFFGSVVHGIESVANENGYNIIMYQSNESMEFEAKGIEAFLSARVDGILVSIAKDTTEYSHFLAAKSSNVPIVFFDRTNMDLGIHSVVIDDYKGAFIATSHLIEQGFKRVAHIAGPSHLKIFDDRLKGYIDALRKRKMNIDFNLIFPGDVSIDAGKKGVKHFLSLDNPPDAIFAVEDFTALGAIKELKEHKIKIPGDFGVMGFANEAFGEHITPTLSTIDQQTVEMGKESFRLLLQLINKTQGQSLPQKIILDPVPIFRESSQKMKN
ncbi:MAG TPA: LacI family DNA-binding transcriptional regulator [Chitinophagaceae bacterium]|jgi:LacI family transcriptional regulator